MGGILEADAIIRTRQDDAPVDVIAMAKDMGINVFKVNNWSDDLSGMIRKDPDRGGSSGYAIYVNARHHSNRQRFTIAHEIAHFALHRALIGDGVTDDALYRSKLSGSIETQANRFAADVLMPWHLIRRYTEQGLATVDDLARKFEVSKSTMSIQLGVPFETD